VALEAGTRITVEALPERVRNRYRDSLPPVPPNGDGTILPEGGLNLEGHIEQIERSYLLAALERSGGVRTHAAELLKMSYRSFRHYAKKYGV
jgi:two-component system response regulator PilR (NtrC family)